MSKQTGGPAFPVSDGAAHRIAMQVAGDNEAKYIAESAKALAGMTLRDYFAAKAMQAMIAAHEPDDAIPVWAYGMADEMLKAREE
ncbi:hypothetical protein MXW66_06755 [Klebsiella pneumoniae]|uniref:hypothetical protein n=1 Tax=Klebsiella pneumoniae TaxID=573 RepID=UPI002404FF50|nr:hypothetical protein [Klebsiella pneumoniae]MDG0607349.1 hypothetical protein [Klebsiella pneumoniae]